MNPIITPDTNPEEFEEIVSGLLQSNDLFFYDFPVRGWFATSRVGLRPHPDHQYFRRKPKQKEPMNKYYRLLNTGETLRAGDIHFAYNRAEVAASGIVGTLPRDGEYARPVEADEWVSQNDQPVTREDFEPTGFINVLYGESLRTVSKSDNSHEFTYWRKITPPTPKEKPIKVFVGTKEETVIFNGGHSLHIGCSNVTVTPETLRKIADKIEGVKKY